MTIDLSPLNEQQRAAVEHEGGHLLVIAAAGSGKTRCLTTRAARLVEDGTDPRRIMLCTFTKKAATEMVERMRGLIGEAATDVRAGTMHSLFLKLLKTERYPWPTFEILDEYRQKRLLRDVLRDNLGEGRYDLSSVIAAIGLWKNDLVSPDQAQETDPQMGRVFEWYERERQAQRSLDFDDMILYTVDLLERSPETRASLRHWYSEILVDEAQDTSRAQWRVLELLAGPVEGPLPGLKEVMEDFFPAPRLTAVCDWRQAIYSWRGARPEYVLDFEERFPGATTIGLPTNYRSTPEIVEAANVLIRHAGREIEDMVAIRPSGAAPLMTYADLVDSEAGYVVGEIEKRIELGQRPSGFAILYRVNAYSRAFEEALAKASIPYTVVGSSGFFARKEVADVLAYLRLVVDPTNEDALRRLVNRPTRYLGKAYCDAVVAEARANGDTLIDSLVPEGLGRRQVDNARALRRDLRELEGALNAGRIVDGIAHIRGPMGYDAWLTREEGSAQADGDRIENLDELAIVAEAYGARLETFLGYVDMQLAKSNALEPGDKVQLMTVHRSKGLEWPVVFFVGVAESLCPHRRSETPEALEEERRLAYVAITRARDEVFVSAPQEYQGRELTPSRFVTEARLVAHEEVQVS